MVVMPVSRPRPPGATAEDVDALRALAFVNTLAPRPTPSPVERLVSYEALATWAQEAGFLKADEVTRLIARARRRPADAARIVARARELRELLHETFTVLAAGKTPPAVTLTELSAQLAGWYTHGRLVPAGGTFQWVYGGDEDLERPLWEVARAATRLLTSSRLGRVRACAAEDCGWWFLDDTKNASRRWCDMKVCGNRDKVRRFRERQRGA
jgi:predicted RNA-binding Zn ribbon-like protein